MFGDVADAFVGQRTGVRRTTLGLSGRLLPAADDEAADDELCDPAAAEAESDAFSLVD